MKRSDFSVYFCLALLIASSFGQLSFTSPYVSNTGEYTLTTESNGQILTLSTTRGFSWLLADTMSTNDAVYASLLCVSSGSNVDLGLGTIVASGYPSSYQQSSVLMPVVGNNFPSLSADTRAFYYPAEPPRAQTIVSTAGINPVGSIGSTYAFRKTGGGAQYALYSGSGPSWTTATTTTFNTVSFEILNSGTAKWCIQTATQAQSNKGVCDPGVTSTCTAPTASTVSYQTDCDSASNMIIYNSACVTQCPTTTIKVTISATLSACQACTSPCNECSSSITSCTSCISTYYLDSTSCVQNCGSGKLADTSTMTCLSCQSPCSDCANSVNSCTSCIANYYLDSDSNTCVQNCGSNQITDTSLMQCLTCSTNCLTCSGTISTCTSCPTNYLLDVDTSTCVQSCGTNQLTDNSLKECHTCSTNCLTCSGTISTCTSCPTNEFLDLTTSTCIQSCGSNQLTDNSLMQCTDCSNNCLTCSGTISTCTSCPTNEFLDLTTSSCVQSCGSNQLTDNSLMQCSDCSSNCLTCSGTISTCTSCPTNEFLDLTTNTCVQSCDSNQLTDNSLMQCSDCSSDCLTCSGTISTCTSCPTNEFLDLTTNTCVQNCGSNQLTDNSLRQCTDCSSSCQTCSGTTTSCTSCPSSSYLYKKTCVSKCPNDYTADSKSGTCKQVITSSSSGLNGWQLAIVIGLPIFCIATSICLYKVIVAKRRRVYPAKDKEVPKRFSRLSTLSPGKHSFRIYPEEDNPRKFTKLPTFSPANHTFRVDYSEVATQKIEEPANFSSSNQKFRLNPFLDTQRNSDELPSFISSHTVRIGSPLGDITRQELSNFAPENEKRIVYPSYNMSPEPSRFSTLSQNRRVNPTDDTGLEFTNLSSSNPTVTHTRELIKQTFNL